MRPPSIPAVIPILRDDSKQAVIIKSLYNSLIEYREPKTNRILVQVFMSLPSKKEFPEYFDIISKPIAMNKIRERIDRQLYSDEESCMEDFKLMFDNCKFFNEDESQIYKDAVSLENFLYKRREQLHIEHSRPTRDSKEAAKEAILNSTNNSSSTNLTTTNNISNSMSSLSTRADRHSSNNSSSNATHTDSTATSNNNNNATSTNSSSPSPPKQNHDNTLNNNSSKSHTISSSNNTSTTNRNATSTNHSSVHNSHPSTSPNKSSTINHSSSNNGIAKSKDTDYQPTDSITTEKQNGDDDSNSNSIKVNHNHHNETSMDSSSNLSADLLASTPVEKCSLNTRRGKNSDVPKRQLLTGYIIYASEIRKQVIDKNPNQNFGDISRLVGNEWKALPHDIRSKYDQRALIHNKRVRERAQRDSLATPDGRIHANGGLHTPKLTKRKLAKLAKEQMRQHHLSIAGRGEGSLSQSPRLSQDQNSSMVSQTPGTTYKNHQSSQPQSNAPSTLNKITTAESSTQTTAIRFVEPPTKKRLVYSETFRKYIEGLQVPNRDLLVEETAPERSTELPTEWLGAGHGRHESPEAALWALRDFMLQDAVTMRRSMEPYL